MKAYQVVLLTLGTLVILSGSLIGGYVVGVWSTDIYWETVFEKECRGEKF